MPNPLKILVVDDHILFREGLASLLKAQPDYYVVGEADSVGEARKLAHDLHPEIILMDFGLPDGTGADAARAILREQPGIKIVFLTVHETDDILLETVHSGAKGYLLKNLPVSKLLSSLRALERDEAAI